MFDSFSAETLARAQFAFTVSFHIIFPAFTIGLASWLAVLNALWLRTRDEAYLTLFEHWKKIFAVAFGMGVVSGIVMSYQFGTNWSVFSDKAGSVMGPLLAYEVLSAFFLEAGFLGIMLFGRSRVGDGLHMFATAMVAVGTLMSAFWILSANSWMQTPQGHGINEVGQFVPVDWWAIVFNPSFPYRLVHMVMAAYLTTAFVVGAVSALHLLRDRSNPMARRGFSMAMWMAVIVTPLQILAGEISNFAHFDGSKPSTGNSFEIGLGGSAGYRSFSNAPGCDRESAYTRRSRQIITCLRIALNLRKKQPSDSLASKASCACRS
jgi:Cytochrome bd-type quinol oxidase, subunit 1